MSKLCLRPVLMKSMSLDPLKGFETQSSSSFEKLSILTQNFSNCLLSECWKGRRTRKRERFAPEIGAYHLTFLFLDFEFEEEKENLTSQLCSLSFNSNWALGPRWAEPTRARVTQGLCGRTWNGAFGLSVPSLAPLGISNNKTMVSNDHWMVHILNFLLTNVNIFWSFWHFWLGHFSAIWPQLWSIFVNFNFWFWSGHLFDYFGHSWSF